MLTYKYHYTTHQHININKSTCRTYVYLYCSPGLSCSSGLYPPQELSVSVRAKDRKSQARCRVTRQQRPRWLPSWFFCSWWGSCQSELHNWVRLSNNLKGKVSQKINGLFIGQTKGKKKLEKGIEWKVRLFCRHFFKNLTLTFLRCLQALRLRLSMWGHSLKVLRNPMRSNAN